MKAEEATCPFCGVRVEALAASGGEARVVRDRAAFLFGAAAIAGSLAALGCNNNATTSGTDGTGTGSTTPTATAPTSQPTNTTPTAVVAPYGVPITHDNNVDGPLPRTSPADAGTDAGKPKPPPPQPTTAAVPAYGLPMPTSTGSVPKR